MSKENRYLKSVNGVNRKEWLISKLPVCKIVYAAGTEDMTERRAMMSVVPQHSIQSTYESYKKIGLPVAYNIYLIGMSLSNSRILKARIEWNESLGIDEDHFFLLFRSTPGSFILTKKNKEHIMKFIEAVSL